MVQKMRKNDLKSHLAAAAERDVVRDQADAMLLELEKFCEENDLTMLGGISLYDRLDREEKLLLRWTGPPSSLVGLAAALKSCAHVELADIVDDYSETIEDDGEGRSA